VSVYACRPLVETATVNLMDWLVEEFGFTPTDAYCLVSTCPAFRSQRRMGPIPGPSLARPRRTGHGRGAEGGGGRLAGQDLAALRASSCGRTCCA